RNAISRASISGLGLMPGVWAEWRCTYAHEAGICERRAKGRRDQGAATWPVSRLETFEGRYLLAQARTEPARILPIRSQRCILCYRISRRHPLRNDALATNRDLGG